MINSPSSTLPATCTGATRPLDHWGHSSPARSSASNFQHPSSLPPYITAQTQTAHRPRHHRPLTPLPTPHNTPHNPYYYSLLLSVLPPTTTTTDRPTAAPCPPPSLFPPPPSSTASKISESSTDHSSCRPPGLRRSASWPPPSAAPTVRLPRFRLSVLILIPRTRSALLLPWCKWHLCASTSNVLRP